MGLKEKELLLNRIQKQTIIEAENFINKVLQAHSEIFVSPESFTH